MSRSNHGLRDVLDARIDRRTLAKGAAAAAVLTPVQLRHVLDAGAQEASPVPVSGGELRLTLGASTGVKLTPNGIAGAESHWLSSCIYNGLVVNSSNWEEVEPALAESWDISDDGLVYTFHLRQGVTWHDGEPFTAADVEFTYLKLLDPALASFMANDLLTINGTADYQAGTTPTIAGIKVIDDHTVSITLDQPNAAFLSAVLTFHVIIPKHKWETVSNDQLALPETWESGLIGTGPFKFVSYEPDRFLQLERYDAGWRGAPYLDKVTFVFVGTTPEAMAAALEAGDLDYVSLPGGEYERMKSLPDLVVTVKPVFNVRLLYVNGTKPYLADKRVRQAIAYAIDRKTICETIMAPIATPNNSFTPAPQWQKQDLPDYAYDPEKAKALLAEAGWDPNQEVVLSLYYNDQQHNDAMAFAQQQMNEAGIKTSVLFVDAASVNAYFYEDLEYDVMLGGYGVAPDFDQFARVLVSTSTWPNGQNAMGYANPRVDELFAAGRATTDMDERLKDYYEVQDIVVDELPIIPFYTLNLVGGFSKRVQNGDGIFRNWNRPYNWNIEKVWVSE
jgi:peptide/nickel transport system substrate-binding protein